MLDHKDAVPLIHEALKKSHQLGNIGTAQTGSWFIENIQCIVPFRFAKFLGQLIRCASPPLIVVMGCPSQI